MIVNAYQTAFHREGEVKIRPIVIPDGEVGGIWRTNDEVRRHLLDKAFYYGQNDFQPLSDRYSVSVGDVIELPDGSRHRVMGMGFMELEAGEDPVALIGREARMVDHAP